MLQSEVIRRERHEQIAELIRSDASLLIARWTSRSLAERPEGRHVHHQVLLDDLPVFLDKLARALAAGEEPAAHEHKAPARQHGEQRWEAGWSLPDVVQDYQLLRTVLFEYLDEALEHPLRLRQILAVNQALDEAIAVSVGRYVAQHDGKVRQVEREHVLKEQRGTEEQLRHQTHVLREMDRHKDEFLAVLGHELRNPLAPIRNVLQVLRLKPSDVATLQWSQGVVERQVQQMTRLVDDLLDVTRLGRGKLQLRQEPVELVRLVRDAAEDRRAAMVGGGVELQVELPPTPVWVRGDQVRLTQVVANLLHNALKFTSAGGKIAVQVRSDEPAGRAVVSVQDTGAGIDGADLPYLFETFRQAERSRHQSQGGLGLGLALVKGFIELHGGGVAAASAGLGQGAEFTFWLPVDGAPAQK